jgi:very-short-patch-repair endonuclease
MSLLLRTIEAFPRGRTTLELEALLDVSFSAEGRQALRSELLELQREGLIVRGRDGRWRPVQRVVHARADLAAPARVPTLGEASETLVAVPGQFAVEPAEAETGPPEPEGEETAPQAPDPHALLRYYRAALLSDTRGAVAEAVDSYAVRYIFVAGTGTAFPPLEDDGGWRQSVIEIRLEDCPDSFREALARREDNERSLAIGWPVAVSTRRGMPQILPVGLLSARWERQGDRLQIRPETARVVANPEWLAEAGRRPGWSRDRLSEIFAGPAGEGLEPAAFIERVRECAAGEVRGQLSLKSFATHLDTGWHGIHGLMGLFLPSGSSFNAGAIRDLEEMARWPSERLAQTAAGAILGLAPPRKANGVTPVNVDALNGEQIRAVENACREPLSVVTGPPGTGKSQAIVSMVGSTLLAGGSVIVASRNHQALDAVEERLKSIAPELPFSARTLDPARELDQGFSDILNELLGQTGPHPGGAGPAPELAERLAELSARRGQALDLHDRTTELHRQLCEEIETLELRQGFENGERSPREGDRNRPGLWRRILAALAFWRRPAAKEGEAARSLAEIAARISELRAELAALPRPEDPVELTEQITPLARRLLADTLRRRTAVDDERRLELHELRDDLIQQASRQLPAEAAGAVIAHRPLWLASALGAPKRIPLADGLFDLAIFDEASQCDIASALPVLARARRAVIVGDDRQLPFISAIGLRHDRNLMLANGVPLAGTGRFAQGRSSLFDLARRTPGVARVTLRNQYRSAPDIVDWLNSEFYAGRLRACADVDRLRAPKGARPGIAWTHVPPPSGVIARGQNVNRAEADAIAAELRKLLLDQGYEGSVGVITPFRHQVLAIEEGIARALPRDACERARLRVGTVDAFQGQERDLILFSPVVHRGIHASAVTFLQRDWRRLNVAISRARAVAHVFGDQDFALSGRITVLRKLAARATDPRTPRGEGVFDSGIERVVFHALRARGLDPRPQYEIAGRRLDFALFHGEVKLDLEIDGRRWHEDVDGNRKAGDLWRDAQLRALGWKVRRFWVDELKTDMEGCLDTVERDLGRK